VDMVVDPIASRAQGSPLDEEHLGCRVVRGFKASKRGNALGTSRSGHDAPAGVRWALLACAACPSL
jgi:hypothetical protein